MRYDLFFGAALRSLASEHERITGCVITTRVQWYRNNQSSFSLVEEALAHPYFHGLHNPVDEVCASLRRLIVYYCMTEGVFGA